MTTGECTEQSEFCSNLSVFLLRAASSSDILVLLLNQPDYRISTTFLFWLFFGIVDDFGIEANMFSMTDSN